MAPLDPGASSISVAVRVRPFTIREAAQLTKTDEGTLFLGDGSLAAAPTPKLNQRGLRSVIKVVDDRCLVFDPPEDNPVQKFSRSVVPTGKKVKDQVFAFDRIFDDKVSQTEVYEGTTKPLLDSVLDGYNATVFAYGATGCGKTHTITGTSQQPGIIFLTMQELFEKIAERSDEKVTELSLSYLEIYNETIRDLLVPGGSKQGLMLREDSHQAVSVAGLTSHHPKDVQEVMDMIVQGNEYRTVSPTEANAVSSRSHAVLQINIAQKDRNADINEPHTMATLSIIDLAGSERASATKNRGERLLEGANINKSLLALGSCINALCDPRKRNHVPYRNSKLTRLLKFSLGGNCKTVMIVCVSPSSAHFDETQNTLRYANRAKNIQTKVTRNVFNVNRHVKDFLVKIDEQMALINELKAQQKDAEATFFAKFRKQMEKRDGIAREGIQRIRVAYDNSAEERQQKIADMKKLKAFERRIGLLSAWIAAFDTICDAREDEDAMPPNLTAMRKTAQGILAELEHSRQHLHQKLEKSNWERAIDTALQHSIAQLPTDGACDGGEIASLTRETELLKSNFTREAYREVLDSEKAGDAATVQILLTAQFDILSSLSETLAMNEEEAVAHAKDIIKRLLETGYTAASHVVKPDGANMPVELFPPTKRGTPKRKKAAAVKVRPVPAPAFVAVAPAAQQVFASPMKSSPRRRKVAAGKKGVSFSPKKTTPSKRSVRWRDDETEEGTLADFEKTPQKFDSTPEQDSPLKKKRDPAMIPPMPALPSYLEQQDSASDSSPSLTVPETSSLPASKPNRFQAGFLSKSRGPSAGNGSPVAPTLSLNLANSSDSEERTTPLRDLSVGQASNHLSPPSATRIPSANRSSLDENNPPAMSSLLAGSASNSDTDDNSSTIDHHKLRSALHSAKKSHRLSSMTGTAASNAKRTSSIGSVGGGHHHHRASASYSGPPPASSTNGISRQWRRGSAERRRSPPITCSPPPASEGGGGGGGGGVLGPAARPGGAFTAGQARRMNMGGSVRGDSGSPRERLLAAEGRARRITIGSRLEGVPGSARKDAASSAGPAGSGAAPTRASVAWR
ncbi:uncharacterized protein E0L32_011618 [Thyridium curvatum]|uniref:Kinesin motor domain-containing protein n=1 Tax=Thyridium curvatum TaxID=1093900 RepID=A0A507B5V1_9PEZI|nr:uncharacterized protein E0L32_011618 [Thyridium curvatum]TPX18505.1 hypothetical protein E0L32_011618 [Thyridium curvatum]